MTGVVRAVFHSEGLNKWRPVRIIIIPVFEMFALRSREEIFTIIEVVPVFKERINLFGDWSSTDSGGSFLGDNLEISFLKVHIFFLEVEEFADSASGIYQHEDDSIIYI